MKLPHTGFSVFYAAAVDCVADEPVDFLGVKILTACQLHHFAVAVAAVGEQNVEQGEGDFALAEVVAGGFADFSIGKVIENIILNLEAEAEQAGKLAQRVELFAVGGAHGVCSDFGTAYEEGGRLAVDDIEVIFFVGMVVAGGVDFVKLAD